MTLKTTTLHTIRDIEVGDRVVFPERRRARLFSTQARHLEVGRPYIVTGVHPRIGTGGTLTLKDAWNFSVESGWEPGSFGFAIFDKVVEETPRKLSPIEAEVRVIREGQSITDQILDLPIGSVVFIEASDDSLNTVLHRTGPDGWLSTRPVTTGRPDGGYYHEGDVRAAMKRLENAGATFTVATERLP